MFVSIIAGIVASGCILAPPVTIKIPLHEVAAESASLGTLGLRFFSLNSQVKLPNKTTVPKSFGATYSALIYFTKTPIAVVAAKDPKQNRFAKIWIDFNRNNKFETGECAVYSGKSKLLSDFDQYTFKGDPKGPSGPIKATVIVLGTQLAALAPKTAMEGSLVAGGQHVKVSIVETDYDGMLSARNGQNGDIVVCRVKDPFVNQSLNQLLPMTDGRYYACSISKKGKLLTLTRDERPLGKIVASNATIASLKLRVKKEGFTPAVLNGQANVPSGEYSFMSANLMKVGLDGKKYEVSLYGGIKQAVSVATGKTTEIRFGEGMKLGISVYEQGKAKSLSLALSDMNGYRVNGLYVADSQMSKPKEPEVSIYAPDGSVVLEKAFEYG